MTTAMTMSMLHDNNDTEVLLTTPPSVLKLCLIPKMSALHLQSRARF